MSLHWNLWNKTFQAFVQLLSSWLTVVFLNCQHKERDSKSSGKYQGPTVYDKATGGECITLYECTAFGLKIVCVEAALSTALAETQTAEAQVAALESAWDSNFFSIHSGSSDLNKLNQNFGKIHIIQYFNWIHFLLWNSTGLSRVFSTTHCYRDSLVQSSNVSHCQYETSNR